MQKLIVLQKKSLETAFWNSESLKNTAHVQISFMNKRYTAFKGNYMGMMFLLGESLFTQ